MGPLRPRGGNLFHSVVTAPGRECQAGNGEKEDAGREQREAERRQCRMRHGRVAEAARQAAADQQRRRDGNGP